MPRKKHFTLHLPAIVLVALGASSCAAFNNGELVLVRNVSFGQELIDLQRAKEEGALTEEEYVACKAKILEVVDDVGTVHLVDMALPDEGDEDHED
jgi:hypothetical protein